MSIAILDDGGLALNGTPMPEVIVAGTSAGGGEATIDSQQHEGGTGADHVFDGWADRTLRIRLLLTEEFDGRRERYGRLAALNAAARALDGEVPHTYEISGGVAAALGVTRALLKNVADVDDTTEDDTLRCTLVLLQVDPDDKVVQAQAEAAAAAATPAEAAPSASAAEQTAQPSADDTAYLQSLEQQLLDPGGS